MKLKFKYKLAIILIDILSNSWHIKIKGCIPEIPGVIAFWHGSMLPVWKFFSEKESTALVSLSKDGEILSSLLERWNFKLIRGSSKKGGKEALRLVVEEDLDRFILITPDGPQGPAKKFKPGAIISAIRRQCPLYLCSVKTNSAIHFSKSWDNFLLPLPFSVIELTFSDAIIIEENYSKEKVNKLIHESEKWLNEQ